MAIGLKQEDTIYSFSNYERVAPAGVYRGAAQSPLTNIGGLLWFFIACHTGALSVSNFDLSNCSGGGTKDSFHHFGVPLPQEGGLFAPPSADEEIQ